MKPRRAAQVGTMAFKESVVAFTDVSADISSRLCASVVCSSLLRGIVDASIKSLCTAWGHLPCKTSKKVVQPNHKTYKSLVRGVP
eukprot:6469862-Amphidinium_carterae.1